MPVQPTEEDNSAAMLVYQANMAASMKKMLELMKGTAKEQTEGVERIVAQVLDSLEYSMGASVKNLGNTLKTAGESQAACAEATRQLTEAAEKLLESNRAMQAAVTKEMERQEEFARELKDQKEDLAAACKEMTEDIGNQLYTFQQMRNLYEK